MAQPSEIEKLEQRYRENPKGRNFAPLADAYRKAGLVDNAIELCQEGLKLHPDYISAHIVYGRCLLDKKDPAGADGVFRRVIELDPENVLALRTLSDLAERGGRLEEALEWLSRLLAADPMSGEAAEAQARLRGKVATSGKTVDPGIPRPPAPPPPPQPPPVPAHDAAPAEPAAHAALEAIELDESIQIERASDHDVKAGSGGAAAAGGPAAEGGLVTYEGSVNFDAVRGQQSLADGLVVQEDETLRPEPLAVEGLASTQFEAGFSAPPAEDDADAADDTVDLPLILPEDLEPRRTDSPAARPERAPPPESTPVAAPTRAASWAPPPPSPHAPPPPEPVAAPEPNAALEPGPDMPSALGAALLSDDDGAADRGALSRAEPVVTETMAELYLQQGHQEDALRVYRALLAQRPDDRGLQRRVAMLEGGGIRSGSGQSVGDYLRGVLRGDAQGGVPAGPAFTDTSVFAQAFDEEDEDVAAPGEPTRPAEDTISLESVFGEHHRRSSEHAFPEAETSRSGGGARPSGVGGAESAAGGTGSGGGFSFDEFFSAPTDAGAGMDESAPARPSGAEPRPAMDDEGDLDQFQAWLKKLKS